MVSRLLVRHTGSQSDSLRPVEQALRSGVVAIAARFTVPVHAPDIEGLLKICSTRVPVSNSRRVPCER